MKEEGFAMKRFVYFRTHTSASASTLLNSSSLVKGGYVSLAMGRERSTIKPSKQRGLRRCRPSKISKPTVPEVKREVRIHTASTTPLDRNSHLSQASHLLNTDKMQSSMRPRQRTFTSCTECRRRKQRVIPPSNLKLRKEIN
jgi:hypothetical protein